MCARLATRAWESERVCASSVARRGSARHRNTTLPAPVVERQTAGATHTRTPVDKRRESEVCESVSELDEFDGERLSQLGERVCGGASARRS